MTWLLEILKIYLEKQLLIKYYVMKHLTLLKIQNMMSIKEVLLQWCINFLIKLSDGGVEIDNLLNQELAKELHIPIIRKFSKQKVQ